MSLNLFLTPGTAPSGQGLPGNAQELYNRVAQYVLIAGSGSVNGINYGADTPPPENRDMPWWRTDADGNPMGMYSWNGSEWVTTETLVSNGPTAGRPITAAVGTEYFDTTISRLLIFERGQWRTADGGIGEIREYEGASIAAVLTLNPGWVEHSASAGRVIGSVNADHAYGSLAGEDSTSLGINQIPAHLHTGIVLTGSEADSGDAGDLVITAATQSIGLRTITGSTTGNTGGSEAHNNLPPTLYLWRICKQ